MKTVDDRIHCPVCGEFNNCSLAQGENEVSKCWCFKLDINQISLNKVRDKKACICNECISLFNNDPKSS